MLAVMDEHRSECRIITKRMSTGVSVDQGSVAGSLSFKFLGGIRLV